MPRRRWLFALGAAVLSVVPVVAWVTSDDWELWFAPELARAVEASTPEVRVVVGDNVHVSSARPDWVHQGCTIAADPSNPARLFAASMVTPKKDRVPGIAGYASHDGGKSWQLGFEQVWRKPDECCCDEAVAFSPDGDLVLAYMRVVGQNITPADAETVFIGSADCGKTWMERGALRGVLDRPQLTSDLTAGPFRGRLYCNVNLLADGHNVAAVYASADGGETMTPATSPSRPVPTIYNSNPVVLADGTVMVAYNKLGESASHSPRFPVWRSDDGGRNFTAVTPVRTVWRHARALSVSGTTLYPRLAADATGGALSGRVYCVWSDGPFIMFAYSTDGGDSWSAPVLLSEQPLSPDANDDYYAGMPAIAVNKHGRVAVLWYDRRGLPPETVTPGPPVTMAGYNLRLRISTDGGLTWLPSIQVNEAPGRGDPVNVRHWVGMVAGADGRFHPAWISDSSGALQVWTVAVALDAAQ
jgi:hypothetical protein